MINKIQYTFSIQDLELLSNIKAHTIRIWEKRYNLLQPNRLNRNIRLYDIQDMQKLLNVSLLLNHHFKISEVAQLSHQAMEQRVKEIAEQELNQDHNIHSLLVSMFTLDDKLFERTYQQQIKKLSFQVLFTECYLPLLKHIGALWQTNSIQPTHEHFISNLIYQKIALNIASLDEVETKDKQVNILFLPQGEIHEIGLYFLLYKLKLKGLHTIYLGRDIPMENLRNIKKQFDQINWVSYFLINRSIEEKEEFLHELKELTKNTNHTCQILGSIWSDYPLNKLPENISIHSNLDIWQKDNNKLICTLFNKLILLLNNE